ncbi:MAG: fructose-6-phosphate aldolase [Bacteroidetes bacterium]|nr:fructose-6-phosphate aldolase [Bacteroidota bacterium]
MYILRIKGSAKIPDYIQIRDNDFTLIAYFRPENPDKAIERCGLAEHALEIKTMIEKLEYGKISKLLF